MWLRVWCGVIIEPSAFTSGAVNPAGAPAVTPFMSPRKSSEFAKLDRQRQSEAEEVLLYRPKILVFFVRLWSTRTPRESRLDGLEYVAVKSARPLGTNVPTGLLGGHVYVVLLHGVNTSGPFGTGNAFKKGCIAEMAFSRSPV